jgi:hypothetical protein
MKHFYRRNILLSFSFEQSDIGFRHTQLLVYVNVAIEAYPFNMREIYIL